MSDEITRLLQAQIGLLRTISKQIERLSAGQAPLSPGYRRRLSEYAKFDWASIGAEVVAQDGQGAVEVEWNRHRFDRKAGEQFGGEYVIFSRPGPGCTKQNPNYHTLIRFADYNDTPMVAVEEAKPRQAKAVVPVQAQQAAPTTNGSEIDDSPTAFWTLASQLIQAGRCTHEQAGQIANATGTWAEKAARLIQKYGPLPA